MSQAAIATPAPAKPGASNVRDLTLHLWVFAIVFATEAIGNISFSIGVGKLCCSHAVCGARRQRDQHRQFAHSKCGAGG